MDNRKLTQKEAMELGKKLEQFYNLGYINKKQALLFSFYKGIASGIGVFLGGTIVIGLLIWVLGLFGEVPLVGRFVENINQTLESN